MSVLQEIKPNFDLSVSFFPLSKSFNILQFFITELECAYQEELFDKIV